ncbi:hypothetical protein F511_31584 [Dorcoceras hygrometricum]|uniref:Splicing factor 3B subunit 1-like n=1 Tax=Dorcoceras hygrometricum TaxID=472368 RepID=A0A2Z7A8D4_9LAMI|nr:hypothetical protein F511_31584 [Dorcoceras hygrometricum]
MESSLISNTIQVYFASVLEIENEGTVATFEDLISSGLTGFLGCSSVIYEAALIEFFQNSSVRNGRVFSTVRGKPVEISEEVFAETFELPMDGLMDMHEVPKDLVFDARSEFSFDGEQLNTSCKKRELKIVFRLLSDILAKSVTVKAGSFDAVTHERLLMMSAINEGVQINWGTLLFNIFKGMVMPGSRQARGYAIQICILLKNVPHLELGDSKEFPPLKILTAKTAVSKKRPAANVDEPTVKRKRTLVMTVAQEAIPLQIIEPTSVVPAEQSSAPKRKAPKRKFRMPASSDDEIVEKRAAVEDVVEKERHTSVDNVDSIIEQILADTAQFETDMGEPGVFTNEAERLVDVLSDTEAEMEIVKDPEPLKSGENVELSEFDQSSQITMSQVDKSTAYFVEEPLEESEQNQGTEITDVVPTTEGK